MATDTSKQDVFRIALITCFVALLVSLVLALFDVFRHAGGLALAFFVLLVPSTFVYAFLFQKPLFAFLVRRFGLMIVTLIGITLVTFIIIRAAPGDPTTIEAGTGGEGGGGIRGADLAREAGKTKQQLLNILQEYTFRARATDPDGDQVKLVFDWGDGTGERERDPIDSGAEGSEAHSWVSEGDYPVRVRARDIHGAESEWSEPAIIKIRQKETPPDRPGRPSGPVEGKVNQLLVFASSARHPAGRRVSLRFDWGDGTASTATDPAASGLGAGKEKMWKKSGVYLVRARARGEKGGNSEWSENLVVTIRDDAFRLVRPVRLDAPGFSRAGEETTVTCTAPANDGPVRLEVEWGDGDVTKTEPQDPKGPLVARHVYRVEGRQTVKARLIDDAGRASEWSEEAKIATSATNRPPLKPEPPVGPTKGKIKTTLLYQYYRWMTRLVVADFGESMYYNKKVIDILPERLRRTVILDSIAFALIYLIAVPIGIYSSTHRKMFEDKALTMSLFILYSLPTFWVGTMLIVIVTPIKNIPVEGFRCDHPRDHWLTPPQLTGVLLLVFLLLTAWAIYRGARRLGAGGPVPMLAALLAVPVYLVMTGAFGGASPWILLPVVVATGAGALLIRPKGDVG